MAQWVTTCVCQATHIVVAGVVRYRYPFLFHLLLVQYPPGYVYVISQHGGTVGALVAYLPWPTPAEVE